VYVTAILINLSSEKDDTFSIFFYKKMLNVSSFSKKRQVSERIKSNTCRPAPSSIIELPAYLLEPCASRSTVSMRRSKVLFSRPPLSVPSLIFPVPTEFSLARSSLAANSAAASAAAAASAFSAEDIARLRDEYQANGFVVVRDFVSEDLHEALLADIWYPT
jgi:hypothetical protein